jgi:hypothetical protein
MNEEMKRIFGKFLFVTVIIVCVSAFTCGSTTVKERGEYNLYLTKYAVMSFSGTSEKIEAKFKDNSFSLQLPLKKAKLIAEKLVCLTPLSPFYYIVVNIKAFIK